MDSIDEAVALNELDDPYVAQALGFNAQYDDECRECEDVAIGNTGYCAEHTPANTIHSRYPVVRLDPVAVDAAITAYNESNWHPTMEYAIAAYIAHIAPQLRDRVEALENAAVTYGRNGDGGDACPEFDTMDDAQAALYALFGLEAK